MQFGFIQRNINHGLVSDGKNVSKCMDQDRAITRYKKTKNYFKKVNIEVYGKYEKYDLPLSDRQDVIVCSKEFIGYLSKISASRLLSDNILGIWHQVMKIYDAVYVLEDNKEVVFFKGKEAISVDEKIIELDKESEIIQRKERIEGYINDEVIYLKNGAAFPLSEDGSGEYCLGLRNALFGDEVEYKKILTGRDDLPLLQPFQYDIIKRMGHCTVFVAPRRMGKTIMLVYLLLRELLKKRVSTLKPNSVLFLGLSDKGLTPVINYIKSALQKLGPLSDNFHHDPKHNVLTFFTRKSSGQGQPLKKHVISTCTFLSAESRNPGVGFYANCVIVDEFNKIGDEVIEGIMPIVTHEGAKFIGATTLYVDSPKNISYKSLLEYEQESLLMSDINSIIEKMTGPSTHKAGLRYTIDDALYISQEQKEEIKSKYLKEDMRRYLCELYSRYPDEGKVFKYESSVTNNEAIFDDYYHSVVIGFDPALTEDGPGVIVLGYSEGKQKLVVLEEHILPRVDKYADHAKNLLPIIKNAEKYGRAVFFGMDGTQKAVTETLTWNGITVHLALAWTSGDVVRQGRDRELITSKKKLIEITQDLMKNDRILLSDKLSKLKYQLDHYVCITNEKGHKIYGGAKGVNDDLVSALMVAIFTAYWILGIKNIVYEENKPIDNKLYLRNNEMQVEDLFVQSQETERYFENFIY